MFKQLLTKINWNWHTLSNILRLAVLSVLLVMISAQWHRCARIKEVLFKTKDMPKQLPESVVLKKSALSIITKELNKVSKHPFYTLKNFKIEKTDPLSRLDQFSCSYQLQKINLKEKQ